MASPYVLCILDGWGIGPAGPYNSLTQAHLPFWSHLWQSHDHSLLEASGLAVGLPSGQMGNSEVGHMTLGAGRVVFQDLPRIDQSLDRPETWQHEALKALLQTPGHIHCIGLLSDGGVHAHIRHLLAYRDFFAAQGKKVWIHAFLDGRDTPPQSALSYLAQIPCHDLATLAGRYYAMDRDQRWERTEKAYHTIVNGARHGPTFSDPVTYIQQSYVQGITDEFVIPGSAACYPGLSSEDGVLFFNFRADRVRQLLSPFVQQNFSFFSSPISYLPACVVGMTDYGAGLLPAQHILYPPQVIPNTLGQVLEINNKKQVRLAETEKYAHVTFFFNGGRETPYQDETRILVPSPRVSTYDLCPGMAAEALTEKALDHLTSTDVLVMNYANPDMVGHTGQLKATIQAVEVIDACLEKLYRAIMDHAGTLLITADHGNCEVMQDDTGRPHTAHTLYPVPFLLCAKTPRALKKYGTLADVAPTLLDVMGLEQPLEMTGQSLLHEH